MSEPEKSVLFVCLGNICRSPAAEGVLQSLIEQRGLTHRVRVDSAGTAGYHIGKPADARMLAAASKRGINLTSRSRLVVPADIGDFDLILAMDRDNYRELLSMATDHRRDHIRMLSDFLDASWPREVPDPYYGGDDGFEFVLDMLEAACPAVLEAVGESHRQAS
jgi:protein-tyrosine phosphatase